MTEDQITPPPPEIVASIVDEITGVKNIPSADDREKLRVARQEYHQRQENERAKHNVRRLAALEAERKAIAQREAAEAKARSVARQKEIGAKVRADMERRIEESAANKRLDQIQAGIQRGEQFRNQMMADARRREYQQRWEQTFTELKNLFDPPEPPTVVVEYVAPEPPRFGERGWKPYDYRKD